MERKSVCKYCFKRFPCGKSLGGHIRTHMSEERTTNAAAAAAAAADNDATLNFNLKLDHGAERRRKKRDLWSESDASIYGLRENPKKTMRFVHSDSNAAAAAAASTTFEHEADEKFCKECGKGFPSLKALCGHMACHSDKDKRINNNTKVVVMDNTSSQSDTTVVCVPRRSKRFKSLTLSSHKHNHNYPSSLDYASSPISYSEVEQEVKIGAMCLILLSKDPNYIDIDDFASQNNLLFLETKSSSFDTKIDFRNGNNFVEKRLIKDIKLKSADFGGFEDYRSKYNNVDAKGASYDSLGDNFVDKRENSWKYERLENESYDDDDSIDDYESDEKSSESDSYTSKAVMNGKKKKSSKVKKKKKKKLKLKLKSKKNKEHECPICCRIFKSGQALGGHKRSHFVGGSEENTLVIKQAAAASIPCLIDLNLPAPVDE